MGVQLLPAFVGSIEGIEEGNRIGHMDGDGNTESGGSSPKRIEARIVHFDQTPLRIVDVQTEAFPDLEALGTPPDLGFEPGGGPLAELIP